MTEDSVVPVEEPTIGVIQMVSSQRVDTNLKRAEALIKEAASEGVKAVSYLHFITHVRTYE